MENDDHKLSVAPMMACTDRHCRYFHRILSKRTFLFTEMISHEAILNGSKKEILEFDTFEKPLALQVGGSDEQKLSDVTKIAYDFGYDEINLNIGCPSNKVINGNFGAILMKNSSLVARCIEAMKKSAKNFPVSIKCRLGVDAQNEEEELPKFLNQVINAGVDKVIIHARKAMLSGFSPKQNRNIPPINYSLVYDMKKEFQKTIIHINGEIKNLSQVKLHLKNGLDGVMIGREAYNNPSEILLNADEKIFGEKFQKENMKDKVKLFFPYIERELEKGTPLINITKHLIGAFKGRKGSKNFRKSVFDKNNSLIDLVKVIEKIE